MIKNIEYTTKPLPIYKDRKKRRIADEFHKIILNNLEDPISIIDVRDHCLIGANTAFIKKYSKKNSETEVLGEKCFQLLHKLDEPCTFPLNECPIPEVVQKGKPVVYECFRVGKNGKKTFVEVLTTPIKNKKNKVTHVVNASRDITLRKNAEEELKFEKNQIQSYLDIAGVMILVLDTSQNIVRINQKGSDTLGLKEIELIGKNWVDEFIPPKRKEDTSDSFARLINNEIEPVEYTESFILDKRGGERLIAWHNNVIRDKEGKIIATIHSGDDITGKKETEEQMRYLAYYDHLTGLPNRALYSELIKKAITDAERLKLKLATLFIDLDNFKHVNDTLGHSCGDQLLQDVAERLLKCVRKSDTIARSANGHSSGMISRLGGDEFILLFDKIKNKADISIVAGRIIKEMALPFYLDEHEIYIGTSIGISIYPENGETPETLLKNADTAMYFAKNRGKNNFQYYRKNMTHKNMGGMTMEQSIKNALDNGEFELFFQPRMDIENFEIIGIEALLRWNHPQKGYILPESYLSVAEKSGLIIPIGKWVLKTACEQNVKMQESGLKPITVSVNVSCHQFEQDNLVETVLDACREAGLDPKFLELEITECAIMKNVRKTTSILKELSNLGIQVILDDFGTGYSSFSQLKKIPLNALKIDKSFIFNTPLDSRETTLTDAIITLAKSLNLKVIAEGVETENQLRFLQERGCREMQGFLLGKPVSRDKISQLLA